VDGVGQQGEGSDPKALARKNSHATYSGIFRLRRRILLRLSLQRYQIFKDLRAMQACLFPLLKFCNSNA
jgi:hypothetical protein